MIVVLFQLLQGCSNSSVPKAKEIKLNEEVKYEQIAFTLQELRQIPSSISSMKREGDKKETKVYTYKLKSAIKNISNEPFIIDKAFFVGLMSIGVIQFSANAIEEQRPVTLSPGDVYTIEGEVQSSEEKSLLFQLQINPKNRPTLILGPFKVLLAQDRITCQEQKEDEYANWEATQESLIGLSGSNEITIRGISFVNTGNCYFDRYGNIENTQNCFDLSAKKGPIFEEVKIIEGKRKNRYFVFIEEKPAGKTPKVVKRYLDELAGSVK